MKRITALIAALAALLGVSCSTSGNTGHANPPLPPGTTVRKAILVTVTPTRTDAGHALAVTSRDSYSTATTAPTKKVKQFPWGTIDTDLWHVHINDRQFFSTRIPYNGKLYTCKVGAYGRVSWHTGRMQWHVSDYGTIPPEVIALANSAIAAENKVRPFVPAGPLPDTEQVGFVTVNWRSLKHVTAYQADLLKKDSMRSPQ